MRLPYVRPRRTIETVEIVFSTSFCAVPGLHARRAGDHLGADDGDDRVVGQPAELRVLDAGDRDDQWRPAAHGRAHAPST